MIASALYRCDHWVGMKGIVDPDQIKGKELLVLHGGSDISPALYNQEVGRAHASNKLSQRDYQEVEMVKRAQELGIPILGICRGAQLLCALGGGSLWQHVDNHVGGSHKLIMGDKVFPTNSYHHQLMRPTPEMEVLAVSECLSPQKWAAEELPEDSTDPEPEIVYFPQHNAIGVQGHPEWLGHGHMLNVITRQLCKERLNVRLNWR